MRESEFIEWIRSQSSFDPSVVPIGPGDDCAMIMCGGEKLLVTTDQLLDGVHFILSEHGPYNAGRKAMARSLSDVAAMAALPIGAVAAVAVPKGFARTDAEQLYHGLREIAQEFDCPLIGGDVGAWDGALQITATVFARPGGTTPILRSGARVGDAVCVTGAFGGAWGSRRHLEFSPRIGEARTLVSRYKLHAMIDVSDGLGRDLGHICEASGVGAEVHSDAIPIHPDAQAGGTKTAPLRAALEDGEDYELLFTLPSDQADQLLQTQPLAIPVSRIGEIVEGNTLTLVYGNGRRETLEPKGWEHQT